MAKVTCGHSICEGTIARYGPGFERPTKGTRLRRDRTGENHVKEGAVTTFCGTSAKAVLTRCLKAKHVHCVLELT